MDKNNTNDSVLLESPVKESCVQQHHLKFHLTTYRFSMLRVPHAINLMLTDIDLWQPVVRVRGSSSRQNSSKMRIQVRKVLPI